MAARHTSPLQALLVDDRFDGDIYPNEPMAKHTTYRIGGPARFYVRVNSISALTQLIGVCDQEDIPWVVVGRGSNLLVADEGFAGVAISLGRDFRTMRVEEDRNCIIAGAGCVLSTVVQEAFKRSLAGLEFAVGTPGTIGGALRMNAGSRGEWIGSHVLTVTSFKPGEGLRRRNGSEIDWGYRCSSFDSDETLLECELLVEKSDPFYIRGKMEASLSKRKKSQPMNAPSCGSVFRNPEGASAGELIEALGLKGHTIGGAQVSEVHANFIVNTGSATANDVRELIEYIQTKVNEAHGIELTPEVKFLGFA